MTTPTWPSGIPQRPDADGFTEQYEDGILRYKTEVGRKTRRRTTAIGTTAQCKFTMSDADADTLRDFYEDDCNYGAQSFLWTHPISGNSDEWQFDDAPQFEATQFGAQVISFTLRRLP